MQFFKFRMHVQSKCDLKVFCNSCSVNRHSGTVWQQHKR